MPDLSSILASWREAEARLKRTERVRRELIIPAVNELRYAGFHLLEGLTSNDESQRTEQLTKAHRHCKRACYDAVEAEVLYLIGQFDEFRGAYKDLVLTEVADLHWLQLIQTVRTAQKFVREKAGESRDEYHTGLIAQCDALVAVLDGCEAARDELNKLRRSQEKTRHSERISTWRWRLGTAIAVVAALAGAGKLLIERAPQSSMRAPTAPTAPTASAATH